MRTNQPIALARGDARSSRRLVLSCLCVAAISPALLVAHYPKLTTDFDRDGWADGALYDTAVDPGRWLIAQSSTNYATVRTVRFGSAQDIPAPGDYDKDYLTDLAVYVIAGPEAGTWRIRRGGDDFGSEFTVAWGGPDRVPVPEDYDTDGWMDIAVYDVAGADAGTWLIARGGDDFHSSFSVAFGAPDRLPFPGDFDKDGWTDLIVYDISGPDAGTWFGLSGKSGFQDPPVSGRFGSERHVPAPGDYDRDGFLDLAVFGTGSDAGTWYIARSRDNFGSSFSVRCGEADSIPVPNDYDHDGFNDLAAYVFRGPRAGTWHLCFSSSEFRNDITLRFGGGGMIPISEAMPVTLLSRYLPSIWP